jgi:hypothetical protein
VRRDLRGEPVIVLEQTAESCPTCDRPFVPPHRGVEEEELVVSSLVIAFVVVVRDELTCCWRIANLCCKPPERLAVE